MQSSIRFCNVFPWLWLIDSLPLNHWPTGSLVHGFLLGFLDLWLCGFLKFWISGILNLLILLRTRWLCFLWLSSLPEWCIILHCKKYYCNFLCFSGKTIFFHPQILRLLTMYQPRLNKTNCNVAQRSPVTRYG